MEDREYVGSDALLEAPYQFSTSDAGDDLTISVVNPAVG